MKTFPIYIDSRSQIPVELNFYDSEGNILDAAVVPFKLVYIDRKNSRYRVEHRLPDLNGDEHFENCYIKDGRLFVRFEHTNFATGKLKRELWLTQEINPEKGEAFTSGKMKYILTENSQIEIISSVVAGCARDGLSIKNNIFRVENIILPNTDYAGFKAPENEIIVNDFVNYKSKIVKSINNKGGNAFISDNTEELADKIRGLIPAEPEFETSGNLNPNWTDLQAKIAGNYREDRKYCWAFSFLGENQAIELTGGDYYICSDGYETNLSETHTFISNHEENKKDNWVIIYTQTPVYVFPSDLSVIGAAFYNTSPERIKFQGTKTLFISQEGEIENITMNLPDYFAQNTGISYFIVPEGVKDLTIGNYAFDGCINMIDLFLSENIKNLSFGDYSFRNTPISLNINKEQNCFLENIEFGAYSFSNIISKIDKLKIESLASIVFKNNSFENYKVDTLTIKSKYINLNSNSIFSNNGAKRIEILADESLSLQAYYIFSSQNLREIFLKNPATSFINQHWAFFLCVAQTIELENGWNWNINLMSLNPQTTESMYQNVQALANRTGQTPLTLTFGATKLNALLAAYPDAAEIATNKNWNLA